MQSCSSRSEPFELKEKRQITLAGSAEIVSIAAAATGEHVTALTSHGETFLLHPSTCSEDAQLDLLVGELQADDRVCPPAALASRSYCLQP
jgi:hypothetical protein